MARGLLNVSIFGCFTLYKINEFGEVFSDKDTGPVKNYTNNLFLKSDTKPIFMRSRTVPFSLMSRVVDEIQRLEDVKIIERVDFSDWVTPIVPVVKPNGSIRLCADYSTSLNKQLQIPQYPVLRLEEIFMKILGVTGSVCGSQLGRVLTHEHFNVDFNQFYSPPPEQLTDFFKDKITLKNVGYIKQYPYSSKFNISFNGNEVEEAVIDEMKMYKKFGGGTIVENSSIGLKRNIPLMVRANKESGVNVIAGTGYYVSSCQSAGDLSLGVEAMTKVMTQELTQGCLDSSSVCCGFIGEVGSSWPITDFERRAIIAAGEVQSLLHCAVSFHPGRDPQAPFEIMRIFMEAGGDKRRTVMSHLDRTLTCSEKLLEFAKLGCYCQFDLFGTECSLYQLHPSCDMPSDAQRLDKICQLIHEGRENYVLMSHDIHTKHRLVNFGGHGYSHIINNVVPKMLIKKIDQKTIDKILIYNPASWLCGQA